MSGRFEERLERGPVIVGDGGMGALVSSAVPRLRCPEEANLRAPESVVSLHAGSIGPLGDARLEVERRADLYAEQARILQGRGVDLFMVETFFELDDLVRA